MSARTITPTDRLRTACTGFYGKGNWYCVETCRRAEGQARPGIGWVQYVGPDAEFPWLAMFWDVALGAIATNHRTCAEARESVL